LTYTALRYLSPMGEFKVFLIVKRLILSKHKFLNERFEQFCINYCNEKLQQLFIELVLKQEQEEYQREKINWQHIEYFNNKIICDLVEMPHKGIISILDEATYNVGKVDDELLLEHLSNKLKDHKHFSSRAVRFSLKNCFSIFSFKFLYSFNLKLIDKLN